MERLFFRELKLVEEMAVNGSPTTRPTDCPMCHVPLASAFDIHEHYSHRMWFEFQFCIRCGWWDVVYREDGMMGENEEESYYQALLTDLSPKQSQFLSEIEILNEIGWTAERLRDLSPSNVEAAIAAIFRHILDCRAELTQRTRDGGKDIIGFDSSQGAFFVEVKRYNEHRRVDVRLVRQLLGVMCADEVHHGVLVTTSSYTQPAVHFAGRVNNRGLWRLDLRDISDIRDWLKLAFSRDADLSALDSIVARRTYGNFVTFPRTFTDKRGTKYVLTERQAA